MILEGDVPVCGDSREAKEIVKEGVPLLEICEKVEASIKKKGGELAFPCNICLNEVAAHYSSPPNDIRTVPREAVVKVDLGATSTDTSLTQL
jgi:methionyl aminopeptidase